MKNPGISRLKYANVENFTTNRGMKIRKKINKPWREILGAFTKREIHFDIEKDYPKLELDENYIYVCNHSFDEDVISLLHTIDRSVYVVNGTTDQTDYNPIFYALWANGMAYLNRLNDDSRLSLVAKGCRVLNFGQNGIMIFIEGGYNNSENRLMRPPFNGAYKMNKKTGKKIVPIICFNEFGSKDIYIRAGEPIDLSKYEQEEAADILREKMATIYYEILTEHTSETSRENLLNNMRKDLINMCNFLYKLKLMKRKKELERIRQLPNDPRAYYLEMRKLVYESQKWHNDVWEEELTFYSGHNVTLPEQAREYVDSINITKDNAWILAPEIIRREEDKYYNLEEYLRRNIKLKRSLIERILKK